MGTDYFTAFKNAKAYIFKKITIPIFKTSPAQIPTKKNIYKKHIQINTLLPFGIIFKVHLHPSRNVVIQ